MNTSSMFKPEYLYQPRLFLKRILPFRSQSNSEFVEQQLPWGMSIRIRPLEEQGLILSTLGVIDLAVTETLWRLTDPGDTAVDVGANIGYMTAVLANRINQSTGGSIWAFEAHPAIFEELQFNVDNWKNQLKNTNFIIRNLAISESQSQVKLKVPDTFFSNRGLASVVSLSNIDRLDNNHYEWVDVEANSLDNLFLTSKKIDIFKLDVEGHELSVLKGAEYLLKEQRIRDCVFEEHREYPTDVTGFFEKFGYKIFRIHRGFWGPTLLESNSKVPRTQWEPTSFLATHQPERAIQRLQERGWKVLD